MICIPTHTNPDGETTPTFHGETLKGRPQIKGHLKALEEELKGTKR